MNFSEATEPTESTDATGKDKSVIVSSKKSIKGIASATELKCMMHPMNALFLMHPKKVTYE
jgi:hypothetical protein